MSIILHNNRNNESCDTGPNVKEKVYIFANGNVASNREYVCSVAV